MSIETTTFMKNKSESRTRRLLKSLFNVRSWIDFERTRAGQRYILKLCGTYFVPQKHVVSESFDDAQLKLNLTDKDILARQKGLYRLCIIMVVMAGIIFSYAIYNLMLAHYVSMCLSFVVMMLALVLAFRYHFWYFQIKQHKLGCTLHDWFYHGFLGQNNE